MVDELLQSAICNLQCTQWQSREVVVEKGEIKKRKEVIYTKQDLKPGSLFEDPSLLVEIKEARQFRDHFYRRRMVEVSLLTGSEQNG